MADYTEGIGNAIREGFCTVAPAVAVGALIFGGVATLGVADVVAGVAAGAVGLHAYNRYCNQALPPEGQPAPQFTGGQCPIRYRVTANYEATHPTLPSLTGSLLSTQWGTIKGLSVSTSSGSYSFDLRHGASGNPGANVTTSIGSIVNGQANGYNTPTISGIVVVPEGGGPDTCGDPPPSNPVLPPGGNIVNSPVTYVNNEGDTINIPMLIAFGYAQINLNGTVEIPIKLNFTANPTLNLSGTLNLNTGDTTFYPDPSTPTGGCNEPPGGFVPDPSLPGYPNPLPPVDPEQPTEADDPETRKILRGVVVTVTSEGNDAGFISQGNNPDIWFPDLGFVQFAVQIGNSIAWLRHEKVNSLRHLIQCDWPGGAITVRGTPRPGVTWTLTPVYTVQTFAPQFPPE